MNHNIGWNKHFEKHFNPYKEKGLSVGRVTVRYGKHYILNDGKKSFEAKLSGKLSYKTTAVSELPVVGDWVVYSGDEHQRLITDVLTRTNKLSRKVAGDKTEEQLIAANVDVAFIVTGLDDDYSVNRIERYMKIVTENNIKPVIILNKIDLCLNISMKISEIDEIASGNPYHFVSALYSQSIDELSQYFEENQTVVLLGSSGAGKSTLINTLSGKDIQKTRNVRIKDSKGKHTTTNRELIILPSGGLIIDNPGIRELQIWTESQKIHQGFVQTNFSDIEELSVNCRFRDCSHLEEPGCAVKQAIDDGTLSEKRYKNYMKLKREENGFLERLKDKKAYDKKKEMTMRFHKKQLKGRYKSKWQ